MWYWGSKYKVELVCNKREFYLYNWGNFFNKLWLYQLLSLLSIGHLTIIMSIIQFSHKYSDIKHVDPLSNLRREKLLTCATTALKPGGNLGRSGESYGPWQLTTHWLRTPNQLLFFLLSVQLGSFQTTVFWPDLSFTFFSFTSKFSEYVSHPGHLPSFQKGKTCLEVIFSVVTE